jgi:MFS family permease
MLLKIRHGGDDRRHHLDSSTKRIRDMNTVPEPLGTAAAGDPAALLAQPRTPSPDRASGLFIVAYMVAQAGNWLALLTPIAVSIALRVAEVASATGLSEAEKTAQLGYVLGIGALASAIAAPIWGALSDRTTLRWGRRKPWMVFGVAGGILGLVLMAWSPNILVLGIGWAIAQIAFNANQAALNALLPDVVADEQRGWVSALLGLSASVALLAGVFITQFTNGNPYTLFLAPAVVTVLGTAFLVRVLVDAPADRADLPRFGIAQLALSFWVNPIRNADYGWAFLSRFLVNLAAAFVNTYGVFYLTDRIGVPLAEVPGLVFIAMVVNVSITVAVSLVGGRLSDRIGRRKPFVWGAAVVAASGLVVVGFSTTFEAYLVGGAIVAVGTGLYYTVDLALVSAVLPDARNSARYMAVFQLAGSLPQSLAPAIAPVLLAIGAAGGAGNYLAVFIFGAGAALVGALAVVPIRGSR